MFIEFRAFSFSCLKGLTVKPCPFVRLSLENMSIVCPSHPGADLVEDSRTGDLICTRCGLAAVTINDGSSSDDDFGEEENGTRGDAGREVGSTNKWGNAHRNYYGTSYVDLDFGGVNDSEEEQMLQLEEDDAMIRQKKFESANSLVNFDILIDCSAEESSEKSELFEVLHITTTKDVTDACNTLEHKDQTTNKQHGLNLSVETARNRERSSEKRIPIENRRKISYKIQKNKGTRKDKGRRKEKQRHSRVMKRSQYEKALIKRRSQVPDMRREIEKYGGEKRGIRISTIRSIKF
uniref:TFIIB-type domain-containing protein n=1 Tax=Globodera rostochiensis TaxID=31243 RepID=A0A914GUY3_GLORO